MTLLVATVLLLQAETPWEQLSAKLLKDHPNDPAVLMLCLDRKDLDGHRRLAALDRSPMTLSCVVNALLSKEREPAVRAEIAALSAEWAEKDPANGYPQLVLGCLRATGGDLPGSLALLEEASRGKGFRTYAAESRLTVAGMLQQRGITDLMALWQSGGMQRMEFEGRLLSALRILWTSAEEEEYRRRFDEAERLFTIQLEIGRRIVEDPKGDSVGASRLLLQVAAQSLYSIALARRKPERAAKLAEHWRAACRFEESMSKAVASLRKTPAGKFLSEYEAESYDLLGDLIAGKPEARKEQFRRQDAYLRKHEKQARAFLDTDLSLGEVRRVLLYLTEEDRRAVASMKTPADHVVELKDVFYPERYTPEHRARLVGFVNAPFDADNIRKQETLAVAAVTALLFHDDREAAAALNDDYVRASLGDGSPAVVERLSKDIEDGILTMHYRALARLGRKETTGRLLEAMRNAMPMQDYGTAISAAYALADLTGKDFGLDVGKWEAFAKEHPALFKK